MRGNITVAYAQLSDNSSGLSEQGRNGQQKRSKEEEERYAVARDQGSSPRKQEPDTMIQKEAPKASGFRS